MINLVICEFMKLKRYGILWFGIVTIIFITALAVFQSLSGSGIIAFRTFSDNVVWNNFSLGFPFVITLIGGFMINREFADDTLKSILTIPVPPQRVLLGKVIVVGLLTGLFGIFSFICTVMSAALVLHCIDMSRVEIGRSLFQICALALFNFMAVAPLMIWFCRKRDRFLAGVGIAFFYGFCGIFIADRHLADFYPVTAGLGIIGYSGQNPDSRGLLIGWFVLGLMVILTGILILTYPPYEKVMAASGNEARKKKSEENRK